MPTAARRRDDQRLARPPSQRTVDNHTVTNQLVPNVKPSYVVTQVLTLISRLKHAETLSFAGITGKNEQGQQAS